MEILVWALWIVSGAHSSGLAQPEIKAYFTTAAECERVGDLVKKLSGNVPRPYQCIQARYWIPNSTK